MEEHHMWGKTFGYQYSTNNDFERAMLASYCKKTGREYRL
jgi:spore photoproduct lyase